MAMKLNFGSLETRLVMAMLLLTVLPAAAVAWIAHDIMFQHIRAERIQTVSRVADSKRTQLVMALTRANDRANSFLSNLATQCGGDAPRLEPDCAARLIESYLAAENALGASLRRQGSNESLTIGSSAVRHGEEIAFQAGQVAQFAGAGPGNNTSYFISAAAPGGLRLLVTYPSSMLEPIFASLSEELGESGETFLADGRGHFVTKPKFHSTQGHADPITARPMQACLKRQAREVIDLDYRDVMTVMGFRFIPEFGSACIMAHIGEEEAFAPLDSLERGLTVAILVFGMILAALAVFIARGIVRPVIGLTKVARAIADGDYTARADASGSEEVSQLALTFNFMTSRLYEQSAHLEDLVRERTKKLEQAQQDALALLQRNNALMRSAMDGIHVMDSQGNVVEANDAFCRKLGYTPEEAAGLNVADWDAQRTAGELQAQLGVGRSAMFETRWRRKDGALIDAEVSASCVEIGGQKFIFASGRDITVRKSAEERLQLSEHSLKEAQRIAHVGSWDLDLVRNVLTWSDEIYRIFEIDPEEFGASYDTFLKAIHPDDRELVNSAYAVSLRNRTPYDIVHRVLMKDGRIKYVKEIGETYYGGGGEPVRSFGVVHDITDLKRAEAVLRTYKVVIDTAIDGFWVTDMEGSLLEANQAYANMSGYTVDELVNMHVSQLEAIEPASDVRAHIAKIVTQGHDRFETRHRRKDGREIGIEVAVAYMGESQRLFVFCRDITERKRAEAQIRETVSLLQATNKALDEFTYVAAHDLKEPLRGIHNYASFLKEDCGDRLGGDARQYIDGIQRLAERLSTLIDRLLAYSRLGRSEPSREAVDVDAVVGAVAEDLGRYWMDAARGGMGIELRRKGPLGVAQGDATRIGEVFQNLISNAAKYNDKPSKWIEVGCDRSGPTPVFYVRDNGIGIQPHHRDGVFRIFKRLHEQNKYGGGTGAGLTIARKIVELHGGRIWLESVPGEGTTFYFTLSEEA